jgi:hypothetical protein
MASGSEWQAHGVSRAVAFARPGTGTLHAGNRQNNLDRTGGQRSQPADVSLRLSELADELANAPARPQPQSRCIFVDENFKTQLRAASAELQNLNQRYAALLKHSSRSVAMMASLFSSFQGQFQEASGPRLKHQTWSCQM